MYFYLLFLLRSVYNNYQIVCLVLNVVYIFSISKKGLIWYIRKIRPEEIVGRVLSLIIWFTSLSFLAMHYMTLFIFPWKFALYYYCSLFLHNDCEVMLSCFYQEAPSLGTEYM